MFTTPRAGVWTTSIAGESCKRLSVLASETRAVASRLAVASTAGKNALRDSPRRLLSTSYLERPKNSGTVAQASRRIKSCSSLSSKASPTILRNCKSLRPCNTESAAPATTFNHNRRKSSSKSSIKQSSRANPVQSLDYETHPQHISRHDRRVIIDHHVHWQSKIHATQAPGTHRPSYPTQHGTTNTNYDNLRQKLFPRHMRETYATFASRQASRCPMGLGSLPP